MQASITHMIWLAALMLASINLHNQPRFRAHKVEYIIQKWMLTAEFEACDLPAAQMSP